LDSEVAFMQGIFSSYGELILSGTSRMANKQWYNFVILCICFIELEVFSGWKWPCHCLILVKTVIKLESLPKTLANRRSPVLQISSITKEVAFELNLTVISRGIASMSG